MPETFWSIEELLQFIVKILFKRENQAVGNCLINKIILVEKFYTRLDNLGDSVNGLTLYINDLVDLSCQLHSNMSFKK